MSDGLCTKYFGIMQDDLIQPVALSSRLNLILIVGRLRLPWQLHIIVPPSQIPDLHLSHVPEIETTSTSVCSLTVVSLLC